MEPVVPGRHGVWISDLLCLAPRAGGPRGLAPSGCCSRIGVGENALAWRTLAADLSHPDGLYSGRLCRRKASNRACAGPCRAHGPRRHQH